MGNGGKGGKILFRQALGGFIQYGVIAFLIEVRKDVAGSISVRSSTVAGNKIYKVSHDPTLNPS